MKIILSFDSFKGCMSSEDACMAAASGIGKILPGAVVVQLPLSDGGEGLVSCLGRILPLREVCAKVHGPLMDMVDASYAVSPDGKTAYMEMAAASGLTLVPPERRDPVTATTYGTGEMISDAIRRGVKRIVMGIGGSATCDGGRGMVEALRDAGCLDSACGYLVACDVDNPLYGQRGAAYVFGPQKGADNAQVEFLDRRLRDFARETENLGKADEALAMYPGAGAAGGLGYAFLAYLKAELRSGIDTVLDLAHFDELLEDADLVITGEGRSDRQTLMGKVPHGVLKRCRKAGVPVWLLSGEIDDPDLELQKNFSVTGSINSGDSRPLSILLKREVAMKNLGDTVSDALKRAERV